MKSEEPPSSVEPASSTMHKDISPINRSISNIADDDKPYIYIELSAVEMLNRF
jgi:hypothetical protein